MITPDYKKALGELLSVIHGDGGHYIHEHGWTKACRDAEAVVCKIRADLNGAHHLAQKTLELYNECWDPRDFVDVTLEES